MCIDASDYWTLEGKKMHLEYFNDIMKADF